MIITARHLNPGVKSIIDWITSTNLGNPLQIKIATLKQIKANYVSITPIMLDMTSYNDIKSH